ncbi:MAG TPA: methionyl-tRNA formyltransferase [Vicinamibacterales bacterium]|nr:methionyl-tRNA formyltransferase [Vicinamibacterales bacterium]
MHVVFFGTPQFAVPSLERLILSSHQVVGVVTQPDRPRGRGQRVTDSPVKATALQHGLPVFQPARLRDPEVAETLNEWAPDLGVVAAYGKIIPESVLNLPRLGMINVHGSLLPRYRGAAPVQRAVIDGVPQTGITIMRMVAALDAGGMFAKATRPIGPDETSDVVERDLADLGAALLIEVIEDLGAGRAVEEPQDEALSTYASKITKDEGLVDWTLPAVAIHNRVRGLYPWPHAFTYLEGERLILMRTHVVTGTSAAEPGTVVDVAGGLLQVATGNSGRLAIDEIQPEGRRAMKIRDYVAGHPIQPGARFGNR